MKALILNSGLGSRMGVLTSEHPKCMTEIYGNETILSRQLKQLLDMDITDVVITTGAHDKVLREYVLSLNLDMDITYVFNPDYMTTNYIYSIYCAAHQLNDDMIIMHGDIVFENSVLEEIISAKHSCMAVSTTMELPKKDFKAVLKNGLINKIGVEYFEDAYAAQPLYKICYNEWKVWLAQIVNYCEKGEISCYAENAFNDVSDLCTVYPLDVQDRLCSEIDTPEDLSCVAERVKEIENRIVYMCFSTDMIHSGHIALIKKAERLGKLIIGVMSDEVVSSYKRFPLMPYDERKTLFANIKGVTRVVEQKTLSYKDNIELFHPTFVVHGDDWKEGFQKPIRDEVIEILSTYGGKLVEYPYSDDPKYSRLEKRAMNEQHMLYIEKAYEKFDEWLKESYIKRVLLVCGNNVKYHPLYKHILMLNERIGVKVTVFSDFTSNPRYESAVNGVTKFLDNECDSILAIGGGSTMDIAKCIKLFATMDHNTNYLSQRIEGNNIPLMVIPTTAGTGSEVSRFAVLYYEGIKQSITHEDCIPSVVFMEPTFLKTVSLYHRKATMLDALCHSIESFWSVNSTEESKSYSKEAITIILDNMQAYLENTDLGNSNMQRASQLAGKAINITQTTAGHAMCYMLTSLYGIAHGYAAALCVEQLWKFMLEHTGDCVDRRGERHLITILRELATAFDCDSPKAASDKFSILIRGLSIQRPEILNDEIEKLVSTVKPERLRNHPIRLTDDSIRQLYLNLSSDC